MDMKKFPETLLRGMGQIMLQDNALTGALFLLGILINSWIMFVGALFGVAAGTLAAVLLGYKKKGIECGLYGFNGALVGIALFFFLVPDAAVLLLVVAGAALSSIVMNYMHERKMSPYTFPFVLSAWACLAAASLTGFAAFLPQHAPSVPFDPIAALSTSLGQVMFQQNVFTGLLFLAGLLASSRFAAAYGMIGAIAGTAAALLFGFPAALAGIGIYGYNAVLSGIAFCGRGWKDLPFALCAAVLSTLFVFAIQSTGISVLTSSFVFATWIVLMFRKKFAS
ncbi:MAG: urea transporter [Candidatus Micrarchaeota archaeon]|nr:urea transporter [Candidatus Micrarchaeota archaeon]